MGADPEPPSRPDVGEARCRATTAGRVDWMAGWTRAECRLCMLKIVLTGVLVRPAAREDRARQQGESMSNQRQTSAAADVHIVMSPLCLECSSPGRLRFRGK